MDGLSKNKSDFSCCFCNQEIIENKTDPIDIAIVLNEAFLYKTEAKQIFFAHYNCFKQNLHKAVKNYLMGSTENKVIINTQYLIQRIMKLKNINQWNVLYYGLKNNYINEQFLLDYCYALIEHNKSKDQFVLDIAAMSNDHDILKLLETKINQDEIKQNKEGIYNKIWAYLSLGTELSHIIE